MTTVQEKIIQEKMRVRLIKALERTKDLVEMKDFYHAVDSLHTSSLILSELQARITVSGVSH